MLYAQGNVNHKAKCFNVYYKVINFSWKLINFLRAEAYKIQIIWFHRLCSVSWTVKSTNFTLEFEAIKNTTLSYILYKVNFTSPRRINRAGKGLKIGVFEKMGTGIFSSHRHQMQFVFIGFWERSV